MNDEFEGHTPGPWLIGRGADGWPIVHTAPDSFSPSGQGVAHVCKRPMCQDHEANARLIAAAPELLDERDRLRAEAEALADVIDTLRADAERYRWLTQFARLIPEHWGGRWSLVIDGPSPCGYSKEAIDVAVYNAKEKARAALKETPK